MFVVVCIVIVVADREENTEDFGDQYREPEQEDPYREKELPEGFEDDKTNLILWCILNLVLQNKPIVLFIKLHIVLLLKHGWIATPWLLWPFLDDLDLSLNMICSVWMINPARMLRTLLLITLQNMITMCFQNKMREYQNGKTGFLENKEMLRWDGWWFLCGTPNGGLVPLWLSQVGRYLSCHS